MKKLDDALKTIWMTVLALWFLSLTTYLYAATVTLAIVGTPATSNWGIQGAVADTRDVMTDVYLDGVLHHTEHDAPYACCFGDDGTKALTGSFGAGSHTILFVFKLEGTTTEVGRNSITVAEGPVGGVPGQPTVTVTVKPSPVLGSATISWNANAETDVAGYKIYRTTTAGVYGAPVTVLGKVTSYIMPNLPPATYYFTVTAYDASQNESGKSSEVSKTIP